MIELEESKQEFFNLLEEAVNLEHNTAVGRLLAFQNKRGIFIIITHFFYKQLHFRAPEPQIFENRSNLASNCRASNRKFLATFEPPIRYS